MKLVKLFLVIITSLLFCACSKSQPKPSPKPANMYDKCVKLFHKTSESLAASEKTCEPVRVACEENPKSQKCEDAQLKVLGFEK